MNNIKKLRTHLAGHGVLYLLALPGIVWLIMFRLIPIAGSIIAFQDYSIFRGITGSSWVGLKHFRDLFTYGDFLPILRNTMILGLYTVVFLFPLPIIVALMINEVINPVAKRSIQTVLYLPHFFSYVIISGFFFSLLGSGGLFNQLRQLIGLDTKLFIQHREYFRTIVTMAAVYRDTGWGTIVYLAAISGISPELYEAAIIDGASRFRRIISITIPSIMPTVLVLLLLRIGEFLNLGFDRIYQFLTPMTFSVGDIFDTYVYRVGIAGARYSQTTAVGLFQSLIGLILIIGFNSLVKKTKGEGLL
jgi:putative aldouronate transport system permease protein